MYTESVSKVGPGPRQSPGVEIPASGSYVPNIDPLRELGPRELSRGPGPTFETLSVYSDLSTPLTQSRRNIKLVISYFGAAYVGWQKATPTHAARDKTPSIEETLEESLTKILQYPVKLQAASRTDAAVHAEGQVVNFFMEKPYAHRTVKPGDNDLSRLKFILNCMLPSDIAVISVEEMPIDFHPTLDSIKKEYWYHICNSPAQLPFHRHTSWHFPYPIDIEVMRKASLDFLGTHDFSAFCNELKLSERNPICHLEKIEITELPLRRIRIALCGDRFLYRMARNIAGTLAHIGCGKLESNKVRVILNNKDRRQAGITAPGFGLTLKKVYY